MVMFIVMCEPDLAAGPMVPTLRFSSLLLGILTGGPMLRRIGAALGGTVGVNDPMGIFKPVGIYIYI